MKTDDKIAKKYPFYFYLLAVFIPIIFFLVLELLLVLFEYGNDIPQWVTPSEKFPDILMLNPEINKRYFHTVDSPPSHNYDGFKINKGKNTFRVFVMGGSSAAGFPYTINGAFSRYIKMYLEKRNPEFNIEVINIAMTAVNTYTLKDLFPGVIEQKPDLILMYTGHNEYYGALGVGSAAQFGFSNQLVGLFLKLQKIKVVQLLRDIIIEIKSIFNPQPVSRTEGTLMSRMVAEKLIPFQSDIYYQGIEQYRQNMSDMFEMAKRENVPLIVGTLISNLKNQAPFVSVSNDASPKADSIYTLANSAYKNKNYQSANELFVKSKELDALRFRAPEALDGIIYGLCKTHNIPVSNLDSSFQKSSSNGIPGDDLFLDHVHPNISGYFLMGKTFIRTMERTKNIPENRITNASMDSLFKLIEQEYPLTRLDSIQADLRIKVLKSSWPFKINEAPKINFKPKDFIDSLALQIITEKITWEQAHYKAALWYKNNFKLTELEREINALIHSTPYNDSPYKLLINFFLQNNLIHKAFPYLQRLHKMRPDAFSAKWLGAYYLTISNYNKAIELLEYGLDFNAKDTQILYNLSGAYYHNKMYNKAFIAISNCLQINPGFPNASILHTELKSIVNNKN